MSRPKTKDTQQITIRMETSIMDRLNQFCEDAGQTKTTAIERALTMYMDDYDRKMTLLASMEAERR